MFLHQGARQRLCEAISNHFCGRGSNERNDPILNVFPNDMTPNIDVFRTSPSNRVQGQINGTLVITMDWDGVVDDVLEFCEEALVPSGLVSRISVTIPLAPNRQMDEESALALWKKNMKSWRTTDRRRGADPDKTTAGKRDLVDTKARMRRIKARIDAEAEEAEEQLSMARLVSAEGGTWGYDERAGAMTVT